MRSCFPWLWYLLPRPFKRPEGTAIEIRKTVEVLGSLLDDARQAVFAVRAQWTTCTAEGQALDCIGADRDLPRLPGEEDGAYRARLLAAFDLYQRGGTPSAIVLALELLGHLGATVSEPRAIVPWLFDGSVRFNGEATYQGVLRWARFAVRIPVEAGLSADQVARVRRVIDRWKAAHTMIEYVELALDDTLLGDTYPEVDDSALALDVQPALHDNYWSCRMYDGTWTFNGAVAFEAPVDTLDVEVLPA